MSKKVLTYVSLAVGCLACLAAVFYLVNTIQAATGAQWTDLEVKFIIYEAAYVLTFACATVLLALGGVRLIKNFLDKKDVNNSLFVLPMATYFASVVIFSGLDLGFVALDNLRRWIYAMIGVSGLVLTLVSAFGKQDEKNSKLTALVATIVGFVLSVVELSAIGGASLVFIMFMFGCISAIYITYVFVEYNNAPKAEANEEKAIETKESNDSEEKAE